MYSASKRGKFRTPYSSAPRGYSRSRAQAAGRRRLARRRRFVPGRDRTGGYYGRYTGGSSELKFHDIDLLDAAVSAIWTVQPVLLTIPEGNGESDRIGRKIVIKSIGMRYSVKLPTTATAANTSDSIRVVLFQEKQANGAVSAKLDVMETDNYFSFRNLANVGRYRILYDQVHDLSTPAGSGRGTTDTLSYGETILNASFYKNCNIPIEYDNSANDGTIGTIRSNNIMLMLGSDTGLLAFTGKMRFRYSDH